MKFILGLKLQMAQIYNEEGKLIPVTLVEAGPCQVLKIKEKEGKDGYDAVQVGFLGLKDKKIKKAQKEKPFRYIREFTGKTEHKAGDKIDVSLFSEGDKVKVSGINKGKGFQGGVKRWGFRGRSTSHGTKHEQRTGGSIGSSFPERVIKGKKMPGHLGAERVSVKNLKIVKIDAENNILAIKGALPGPKGALLEIISK